MPYLEIKNCTECPHHKVLPDPDRLDSFCSDDVKVVCQKRINKNGIARAITVACRPYNIVKESEVPTWCPLAKTLPKKA